MNATARAEIRDERLLAVARVAETLGASELADDARATAARLDDGLFYVAVLGQFKRGKSTLINAFAGCELLPTGVAPVTSVVTVIRYGAKTVARARFRDGTVHEVDLGVVVGLVSEAENPSNRKGVTAVEIELASPLLRHGLCLADTPGLGSINTANTTETRAFLPHVDAAVLVVGVDPPITGDELALLRDVGPQVRTVLVVLAKADRATPSEIAEARRFTTRTIEDALPALAVQVFEVSAREVLAVDLPTRDWTRMTRALEDLAQRDGADLVERARERETLRLTGRARAYLEEIEGALTRPVAETETRVHALADAARAADRALMELRHLFDAEQHQIDRDLEARLAALVDAERGAVRAELARAMADHPTRAYGLQLAPRVVEAKIRAWRDITTPEVERAFEQAAHRFVARASEIAATIRAAGAGAETTFETETRLSARSRFYMLSLMTEGSPSLAARVADQLRGKAGREAAALRAAETFADRLLQANANRIANDLVERMIESRRGIEAALRKQLDATATAAREAAARARAVQAAGAGAVEQEQKRLAELRAHLAPA